MADDEPIEQDKGIKWGWVALIVVLVAGAIIVFVNPTGEADDVAVEQNEIVAEDGELEGALADTPPAEAVDELEEAGVIEDDATTGSADSAMDDETMMDGEPAQ